MIAWSYSRQEDAEWSFCGLLWWCFHGCVHMARLTKVYSLDICRLLYTNYISIKPLREGKRRRREPWVLWFLAVDWSLQDTSKSSKIWEYLSNLEIRTGNSRSHRVFQGLYKFKGFRAWCLKVFFFFFFTHEAVTQVWVLSWLSFRYPLHLFQVPVSFLVTLLLV